MHRLPAGMSAPAARPCPIRFDNTGQSQREESGMLLLCRHQTSMLSLTLHRDCSQKDTARCVLLKAHRLPVCQSSKHALSLRSEEESHLLRLGCKGTRLERSSAIASCNNCCRPILQALIGSRTPIMNSVVKQDAMLTILFQTPRQDCCSWQLAQRDQKQL